MRPSDRCARLFVTAALLALAAVVFPATLAAQDDAWQIVRADYGFRNQRADVTNILRDMMSRGGVNGRIAVNNQTMGGDPAVGRDKTLRIFARDRRNQEREFDYNEGGFVIVGMFAVRSDGRDDRDRRDDHDRNEGWHGPDRPYGEHDGDRDRDDSRDLGILMGFYGVQGRTVNVTDLLRSMVREGGLTLSVNNRSMGGDPAVGADKVLIVVYKSHGKEQATAVPEGGTLSIP